MVSIDIGANRCLSDLMGDVQMAWLSSHGRVAAALPVMLLLFIPWQNHAAAAKMAAVLCHFLIMLLVPLAFESLGPMSEE